MAPLNLLSFPEELLERILAYCVVAHTPQPPRPSWHRATSTQAPVRGRLAVLLVSKKFLRISTPLFYHTVHINSPTQLHNLLSHSLRPNVALANYIKRLVLSGTWADAGELLQLCHASLESLDIVLDAMQLAPGVAGVARDLDAEDFCAGLAAITAVRHLVVRKAANIYLTQPRPRFVLGALADALSAWPLLEHADLAFRVADDGGPRTPPGPVTALTRALATRPRLHTLSTLLPSVWNECMLRISANPALERIVLADGAPPRAAAREFYPAAVGAALGACPMSTPDGAQGIPGTGLFFLRAKKHTRLCELIRAGTSITRTRAQTMGMQTGAAHAQAAPRVPPATHHARALSGGSCVGTPMAHALHGQGSSSSASGAKRLSHSTERTDTSISSASSASSTCSLRHPQVPVAICPVGGSS